MNYNQSLKKTIFPWQQINYLAAADMDSAAVGNYLAEMAVGIPPRPGNLGCMAVAVPFLLALLVLLFINNTKMRSN